ncbi:MAG: hypothetical protein OQK12_14450, partial [Motiliproteus sp.]|nr:hypothetical protein [Motiliproteus sp.]
MRISTLSRGSAGLLLLASVGMACSVFWGLEKLKEPYRLNESYFGVVEQVSVKTRLLIDNYLRTGDAADLQKAQGFLAGEFKDSLSQLPSSLQTAIFPAINDLQQSMEVDLRSAGKLAGGIQSLLLQNEREQIASLDSLQDYVTEAEHSASAELVAQYRAHISKLLHLIAKRSILRSSYFSAPSSQIKMSLEQISQDIESEAQTIQKLPLLGVKAEVEEDEFAALMGLDEAEDESSAESIDKGEEIGGEIAYLAGRYLPELERTVSLVELGISAKIRVGELTRALEQRVKASKSYIDQERQNVEDLVITLLVGFLLLLFIVCVISAILQLRVLSGMSRVSSYI